MPSDRIYALPLDRVGDFTFDDAVADVFPDMIARSVPGYASVLSMTAELAERYATAGTNVYDLGCSLGGSTLLMRPKISPTAQIIAVDSAPAMVSRLRNLVTDDPDIFSPPNQCSVKVIESDLRDVVVVNASFVVLNYTLQFIDPNERDDLLQRICHGIQPGGALVLSEKIKFDDPTIQSVMSELHHDFKRAQGYSDLEIAQKRTALENTLIPETIERHCRRLRTAGFATVCPWFQCFNFASILAVK